MQLDAPGGREVPSATRGGDLFITNFLDAPATAYLLLRQARACALCEPSACARPIVPGMQTGLLEVAGWRMHAATKPRSVSDLCLANVVKRTRADELTELTCMRAQPGCRASAVPGL